MASPKPIAYYLLAALAAVAAALSIAFYFAIWPWMAPPPADASTIDSRWSAVERWAAYDRDCMDDPIDPAIVAAGSKSQNAHRALFSRKTGYARLDKETLSVEVQTALRGLEDWSKRGGGLVARPVPSESQGLPLYWLGQVALATASDLEDPAVGSALHTAKTLRRCGDFMGALAGFGLSGSLVRWLEDRGRKPDARFAAQRPTRDELFVALSREMVHTYEDSRRSPLLPLGVPGYAMPFMDADRERAWWKHAAGERLLAANTFGKDPAKLAALFPSDVEALPKSSMVRWSFTLYGGQIARTGKAIERYDAALAAR
jgi:hypothetical protein